MHLYTGCVENRKDPMKLGRCQIRVVGVHTHDKTALPTEDLPWAYPMQPITSAAMNGIGQTPVGVVEGTWVVVMFRDEEKQQPIILGTIGGIPQQESKNIDEDEDDTITIDSGVSHVESTPKGDVVVSGSGNVITDGNGNPWTTGTSETATRPEPKIIDSKPGTAPPPKAKPGIDALNRAMDAANIRGKYGRAAILGIVGGECGWIPQEEGYNYSAQALQAVFKKTFGNNQELALKYARWKGTREAFFDFVYAPENNGNQLGNNIPGDGGRFYGRGFIQLTGRSNYTRYARLSGIDILGNPAVLNTDYDASARVAVAYMQDRVKVSPDDPSYMEAALKAVGNDAGNGYEKKRGYYRYFLGEPLPPPEQTNKSTKPEDTVQNIPLAENGLPADRQKNLVIGFSDPNMKYPLRDYIGEPDTNRLGRGKVVGTCVEFKDKQRLTGVETARGITWNQVNIPYNAQYPYNKVTETESGHVFEFDDTPENERIHLFHRRGTFLEVDANGTQVNRIVGDGYHIIDRNGYVLIEGAANITVRGNCNLLVEADANIDVSGDTNVNMAGNANFNVAADMALNIGGELKVRAANIKINSESDFNVTADGDSKISSSGSFNSTSGSSTLLTASGSFEVNASGQARIEGSTVHWAEGAASAAGADSSGLGEPIDQGVKNTQTFEQLQPPPRNIEDDMKYETPEENESDPEKAKEFHDNRPTTPTDQTPVVTTPEDAPIADKPLNELESRQVDCSALIHMSSFPDSYVLHTDSTGYAWTIGTLTKGRTIVAGRYGLGLGRAQKEMSVAEIVCNLKGLCVNILGPINESVGRIGRSWNLNSCYRNDIPQGGSATSQHLIGSAADISIGGNFNYKGMFELSKKLSETLPYDQLLLEYRDRTDGRICWIHASYNNYGPPKKDLRTFLNDKTHVANKLVYLGT